MDLDARVGFYIPKRSSTEGILLLNSFKWDWPTIYGSIFNYVTQDKIDDSAGEIVDIVLSDVNSFQNIERAEKSYMAPDYEIPDDRKVFATRSLLKPDDFKPIEKLFETKFDWGLDL